MAGAATRTPRTGRPPTKSGEYRAVMFRWPVEHLEYLHAMAMREQRSVNTVAFRIFCKGLSAEGHDGMAPEASFDTRYNAT